MSFQVKERGILFTPDNVRAILDGRKTQTRRVITPKPIYGDVGGMFSSWQFTSKTGRILYPNAADEVMKLCPYGQVGDRLWVKESWCCAYNDDAQPIEGKYLYKGDGQEVMAVDDDGSERHRKNGSAASPWQSAMFMPKKASRLWLEITDIRVERVQDISGHDAEAEGVEHWAKTSGMELTLRDQRLDIHQLAYSHLWDSINKKNGSGWDVNPWVWALTFKRVAP